ncbi:MAG TPA: leucyl aminopeptidase, partial [Chlamydiales bacterium]|nr:leucyl aminopeptidase [Chlamydiales bacterium]
SALISKVDLPLQLKDFTGKAHETLCVYSDDPASPRLILLGLGEADKMTHESLRRSFGAVTRLTRQKKMKSISVLLPDIPLFLPKETAFFAAEGLFSANYVFDALKCDTIKKDPTVLLEHVEWIGSDPGYTEEATKRALIISKGVKLARDLANGNADDVTPEYLADVAKHLAAEYPLIETHVHGKKWIEEQRMGLYLAVSQGSIHSPQFIVAKYRGNPTSPDHTVLVGKGVTFDTGGLNLKPVGNIEIQKGDMSGAAIVFATLQILAELHLPVNVTAVVPACENAIGSKAYKPGDVYKSASGRTVEINSTDAEGRLTLADALYYAVHQLRPSRIIDFATLTAAMVIAGGGEVAGLFSNSDSLARELELSGEKTFERTMRMPLYEEYKDYLKSDVADTKNSAGREGGAILAAIFLQEFVGHTVPWAHFDIAGVASQKEEKRYSPKMATGFGVRLMIDYFEKLSSK